MLKAEDFFVLSDSFPFKDSFLLSDAMGLVSKIAEVLSNIPLSLMIDLFRQVFRLEDRFIFTHQ